MASKNSNYILWDYFNKNIDLENRIAECNSCHKYISYKTTITNLKQHLKIKHKRVYDEFLARSSGLVGSSAELNKRAITTRKSTAGAVSASSDADSDDDTKVFEVSSFFDQESSEWAMCRICKATVSNREQALMKHIEKHPKLLKGVQDSDAQNDDDEQETYTEVVYLDDFDGKRDKKEKSQWQADTSRTSKKPWKKRRRRVSSSSEDEHVEKKKKKCEKKSEITIFGEYIMCLIEKLPPDVCKRTQMNIINVVMNAYLENGSSSDKASEVMTQDNVAPEVILTENGVVQEIQVDECSDNA
ncbi:uncharacterized protein LOC106138961 isoform X3 [Amyelois transitella]|uniref:uncharacterized protein LOC106138961 isoform X3 n=1 Tax=Amyelois transitella TaxID=680683 RepID=UPI002990554D|nr:uncharacterized protein LOC106138961 isoform X3 [Amyelois transitella]